MDSQSVDPLAARPALAVGYDRPAKVPNQSRSVTVAKHGIVAASQPAGGLGRARDSQARRQRGRRGHRHQCHAGADRADELRHRRRSVRHLLGQQDAEAVRSERQRPQPLQTQSRGVQAEGPHRHSRRGRALLVGARLRGRLGRSAQPASARSRWRSCCEPAIGYAEDGFPGQRDHRRLLEQRRRRACTAGPTPSKTYLPEGHVPVEGEIFRNPMLAASYRAIASDGAAAFYKGAIAQQIASFSEAHGGYFALAKDLADHTAIGSSRCRPTIAATTCGNCRPMARASPPCRCSI